jgi:hypothetical protein
MRRPFAFLVASLFAFALIASAALVAPMPASAATIAPTTTCGNGMDNTPGLGMICRVTVVNTITPSGGTAAVTVRECHGSAGDPRASCETTTSNLTSPVTAVNQCNDAINGGGGTLRCSVEVTNNFVGLNSNATTATVNQCVGSGGGITTGCDPFPATTTGATITQCNGSANGGTLVELTCIARGSTSPAARVTINQCNGSANGGGALVICSTRLINNIIQGAPTPTPTSPPAGGGGGGAGGGPTIPPTDVARAEVAQPDAAGAFAFTLLLFATAATFAGLSRRYGHRRVTR